MKKIGAFVILFLLVLSVAPFAMAAENDTDNDTTTTTQSSSSSTSSQQDPDKTEEGFECLEEKADDCSDLTTQELALTILATPDNIFDECVEELKDRESADHWGNVRDTALAIIALDHAGEDTEDAEAWLIDQEKTSSELVWYVEQDSNEATKCHLKYGSEDYTIDVGENKKINKNAGSCLTRAQSNFWLRVSSNCYDREFTVECDKDFIATLLYKNSNSPTIYVLSGTESAPAFGSIKLNVDSKCFGSSSSCDYESTAWATVALLRTGHDIESFVPYVIAMADSNERYLPKAFIYMVTSYEDYASQLIKDQKLGNYWEADSSAYNRFYDTSLAILALGGSSEQVTKAKDWLLFSQGTNGCWQNSIRDTGIVLWALTGRSGRGGSGGSTTYCSESNYFCIPDAECPTNQKLDNFFCSGLSTTCCESENLQTCSEYSGTVCLGDLVCTGNERRSTDSDECCVGECVERSQENECESMYYTCMDSCSDFQESVDYSCDGAEVCCRTKTDESGGSTWWIWVLIILIIIVLVVIGWIYRDRLKLFWFQLKSKFKKDKGTGAARPGPGPRPGVPPRPGFPPIRRAPVQAARPGPGPRPRKGARSYDRRDKAMGDVFKKLRDMSS